MNFEGKTVAITGGASGIGRSTVIKFAAAGARVYFGDIDDASAAETVAMTEEVGAEQAGGNARFIHLDVGDAASIAAFAEQVEGEAGKADVVVNVAGWDRGEPFLENTPDFIEKVVDINFYGPIRFTRAFLPKMVEAQSGKIVSVSSDAGRVGSMGETVYSGAKGGIIAFSKSLAREMARHRINVNVVCPGPTDTPLFQAQGERLQQALIRAIPFRRLAQPDEITNAILFFASDLSDYVTGQVLSVSGGLTMAD